MAASDAASALTSFGFTGLESEIYAFLVGEPAATGYRIAQAIGKPVANTYKAIQTLQAKGAIAVDEGDSRLCRAVPSDELLDRLGREFEARRAEAKAALSRVQSASTDDRIYQIRSRTQAMQRARQMLEGAQHVALFAARGEVIRALVGELEATAARGVELLLKSDDDFSLPRIDCFVVRDDDLLRHGPFVRLVADGAQVLAGQFGKGDEAQVIWSGNTALALLHHEGLSAEIALLSVAERIEDGAGPKRLAKALVQARPASKTAGASKLG